MAKEKTEFRKPITLANFLQGDSPSEPVCPIHFNDTPYWYARLGEVFAYTSAMEQDVRHYWEENTLLRREITLMRRQIEELQMLTANSPPPRAKKKAAKKKAAKKKALRSPSMVAEYTSE